MAKMKDIRNFFNSQKEVDTPALAASDIDDVSQSELLIVDNEIKKSTEVKKNRITNITEKSKAEVKTYALIYREPKLHSNVNKIYPKYTFLKTSINNWKFKIRSARKEQLFSNGNVDQIYFQMTSW